MKKLRIAVSKGHNVFNNNIFDSGASGQGRLEAVDVDKTVNKLIIYLKKQGHEVFDITPKNQHFRSSKEAHKERARRVNSIQPDLYMDIHENSGGGTGPEMFVYKTKGLAYDYARKILNSIVNKTGLRNRGVKVNKKMWSLYMTNCPSIVVEGGFIDNKKDMKVLTPDLYARSIAEAFGNVKRNDKKEVYSVKNRKINVNGKDKTYKTIVDKGITFVELRKFAEDMNNEVYYDDKTAKVSIKLSEVEVVHKGKIIELERFKLNDLNYVELRKVLENLGHKVKYNPEDKRIYVD